MSDILERTEQPETLEDNEGLNIDTDALFNEAFESIRSGKAPPKEQPEPVEEPKQDAVEPEQEEPTQPPEEEDWISKIPEELRDKVGNLLAERDYLQNNYKAVHNRLAPTQRQLAEAQRRLREREQLDVSKTQPAQKNDSSEKQAEERDELWSKIEESDPVLAEALEKRLAARLQQEREALRKEFQDSVAPLQQRVQSEEFDRELNTLLSVVPNATEVLQSPEYVGWLEAQSPSVQALHTSPKAQDCIKLLQLYSWDAAQIYGQYGQQASPQQKQQTDTTEADRIAAQRKERLANPVPATGTRPTAPKAKPLDTPESLEKLFNDTLEKELKQQKTYGLR